jgi:hypothetical protein
MHLTKECINILSFFIQEVKNKDKSRLNIYNPFINEYKDEYKKNTLNVLKRLFYEMKDAWSIVLKQKKNMQTFGSSLIKIGSLEQMPQPSEFLFKGAPGVFKIWIFSQKMALSYYSYTFNIAGQAVQIYFILQDKNLNNKTNSQKVQYDHYADAMIVWLTILSRNSTLKCFKPINIYIYHNSLLKNLPANKGVAVDVEHVNTAFTTTCNPSKTFAEIFIFRQEEWFKVFIHESFHTYGLDFSAHDTDIQKRQILSIFPVKSEVNLFEAYTETWARIINICFCSFFTSELNLHKYLSNCKTFMQFEQMYSCFQMVKVLDYMGLQYETMFLKTLDNHKKCLHQYKENTNVLAYYIITFLFINNYQGFLMWCNKHNLSLFQFNNLNPVQTQLELVHYIKAIHNNEKTISHVRFIEYIFSLLKKKYQTSPTQLYSFLLTNLRMTVFEFV